MDNKFDSWVGICGCLIVFFSGTVVLAGCASQKVTLPVPEFSAIEVLESADAATRNEVRTKAIERFVREFEYWKTTTTHVEGNTFSFKPRTRLDTIWAGTPEAGTYDVSRMRINKITKDSVQYSVFFDRPNSFYMNFGRRDRMFYFIEACEILGVQINRE